MLIGLALAALIWAARLLATGGQWEFVVSTDGVNGLNGLRENLPALLAWPAPWAALAPIVVLPGILLALTLQRDHRNGLDVGIAAVSVGGMLLAILAAMVPSMLAWTHLFWPMVIAGHAAACWRLRKLHPRTVLLLAIPWLAIIGYGLWRQDGFAFAPPAWAKPGAAWYYAGWLVLLLAFALRRRAASWPAPPPVRHEGKVAAAITLGVFAVAATWPAPWQFDPAARRALVYPHHGETLGLSFHFATTTTYPDSRTQGAAQLQPVPLRNSFFGTHVDGPEFKGRVISSTFPVTGAWLIVPVAGFPLAPGNALQLELHAPGSSVARTIPVRVHPGVAGGVGFGSVDLREFKGATANLVLIDGRDESAGWLAVAPPWWSKHDDAAGLCTLWSLDPSGSAHRAWIGIAALLALATLGAGVTRITRRK